MKIAVAGKGGVGKTTISAGLALSLAAQGERVTAVDADPNNCLGFALGIPAEQVDGIKPLSEMEDLLAERAGSSGGGMFNIAPEVTDIIEEFKVASGNIELLVMGTIDRGGGGCACPLNATLKQVLRELVWLPGSLLVDMEAGLEHLGRGTAAAVNAFLIIVDPTQPALRTAPRISRLVAELGIKNVWVIGNRASTEEQRETIRQGVGDTPIIGFVSEHEWLAQDNVLAGEAGQALAGELRVIIEELQQRLSS